jgi:hypothetical protein
MVGSACTMVQSEVIASIEINTTVGRTRLILASQFAVLNGTK